MRIAFRLGTICRFVAMLALNVWFCAKKMAFPGNASSLHRAASGTNDNQFNRITARISFSAWHRCHRAIASTECAAAVFATSLLQQRSTALLPFTFDNFLNFPKCRTILLL